MCDKHPQSSFHYIHHSRLTLAWRARDASFMHLFSYLSIWIGFSVADFLHVMFVHLQLCPGFKHSSSVIR